MMRITRRTAAAFACACLAGGYTLANMGLYTGHLANALHELCPDHYTGKEHLPSNWCEEHTDHGFQFDGSTVDTTAWTFIFLFTAAYIVRNFTSYFSMLKHKLFGIKAKGDKAKERPHCLSSGLGHASTIYKLVPTCLSIFLLSMWTGAGLVASLIVTTLCATGNFASQHAILAHDAAYSSDSCSSQHYKSLTALYDITYSLSNVALYYHTATGLPSHLKDEADEQNTLRPDNYAPWFYLNIAGAGLLLMTNLLGYAERIATHLNRDAFRDSSTYTSLRSWMAKPGVVATTVLATVYKSAVLFANIFMLARKLTTPGMGWLVAGLTAPGVFVSEFVTLERSPHKYLRGWLNDSDSAPLIRGTTVKGTELADASSGGEADGTTVTPGADTRYGTGRV